MNSSLNNLYFQKCHYIEVFLFSVAPATENRKTVINIMFLKPKSHSSLFRYTYFRSTVYDQIKIPQLFWSVCTIQFWSLYQNEVSIHRFKMNDFSIQLLCFFELSFEGYFKEPLTIISLSAHQFYIHDIITSLF